MNKKTIVAALALTLSLGVATSVYATSGDSASTLEKGNKVKILSQKGFGMKDFKGKEKHGGIHNVLTEKFGITEKEIMDSLKSGTTLKALIEAKGISFDEVKNEMIKQESEKIDGAVTNGKITSEKAKEIKANLEERISNMLEKKEVMKKKNSDIKHMVNIDTILKEKFGLTDEELSQNRKSEKSMKDLLESKGINLNNVKAAIVEAQSLAIDEAVSKGEIAKDKGEEIKAKAKEKIEAMTFDKTMMKKEFKGERFKGKEKSSTNENEVVQ